MAAVFRLDPISTRPEDVLFIPGKESHRKQRGISEVAAVGSTADRHPAGGGYQLHAASFGAFNPRD